MSLVENEKYKKYLRSRLFEKSEMLKNYYYKYGGDIIGTSISGIIESLFKKYNAAIAYSDDFDYLQKIDVDIVQRLGTFKRDVTKHFKLGKKIVMFTVLYIFLLLVMALFAGIMQSILGGIIGISIFILLAIYVFAYKRFIRSIYDKIDFKEMCAFCDDYFKNQD